MSIIGKLKDTDLADLKTMFEQSNEDSKTADEFEFVKLPDGIYIAVVKKFEFKTKTVNGQEILKGSWHFQIAEGEEQAGVLQFKTTTLDSKDAMTRFLRDVRKFGVEFETFDELLETLNDQVIGQDCLIELEAQQDNPDRQWLNIIVEEEDED